MRRPYSLHPVPFSRRAKLKDARPHPVRVVAVYRPSRTGSFQTRINAAGRGTSVTHMPCKKSGRTNRAMLATNGSGQPGKHMGKPQQQYVPGPKGAGVFLQRKHTETLKVSALSTLMPWVLRRAKPTNQAVNDLITCGAELGQLCLARFTQPRRIKDGPIFNVEMEKPR